MKNVTLPLRANRVRLAVIVVLLAVALLGAYRYADANKAQAQAAPGAQAQVASTGGNTGSASPGSTSAGAAGGGGGCCGGGGSSTPIAGAAEVAGGVQKISVDLSSGSYDPNVLKLKAGVPAEITFGQSSGCTGYVQSQDLGFEADLTGGPQTVKLPGLQPGQYNFACGMGMVSGQIVVE
jgi:hypothetical protein